MLGIFLDEYIPVVVALLCLIFMGWVVLATLSLVMFPPSWPGLFVGAAMVWGFDRVANR